MKKSTKKGRIIIPAGRKPWPHELRVAEILAAAGHMVEFLPETSLRTADILLDGVEYEIKSPRSSTPNSLEHLLKKSLKQSQNIIISLMRINGMHGSILHFLAIQAKTRKRLKKLLVVTKQGRIIDISG